MSDYGTHMIRRLAESAPPNTSVIPEDRLSTGELDDLVDRVVDRIERRVVDELERRGRHHIPGAF